MRPWSHLHATVNTPRSSQLPAPSHSSTPDASRGAFSSARATQRLRSTSPGWQGARRPPGAHCPLSLPGLLGRAQRTPQQRRSQGPPAPGLLSPLLPRLSSLTHPSPPFFLSLCGTQRFHSCEPVGVLCEITNEDGSMSRQPQLREFCKTHNLPLVLISDLIRYRRKREVLVERTAVARLPTEYGVFQIHSYTAVSDGIEHVAMVMGDIGDGESVLARVHSECLTGDIFSSSRCDCGPQLNLAMARVAREGRGVIVYLRGQEGRGIGLGHKLQAYNLQDEGRDTVEANVDLGLPIDARDYGVGAQILKDIGVRSLRLMTNNPAKFAALTGHGLKVVGRVPLITPINPENKRYIETKRVKMGHFEGAELVQEADLIPTGPNGEEPPRFAPAGAAARKAGLT